MKPFIEYQKGENGEGGGGLKGCYTTVAKALSKI